MAQIDCVAVVLSLRRRMLVLRSGVAQFFDFMRPALLFLVNFALTALSALLWTLYGECSAKPLR